MTQYPDPSAFKPVADPIAPPLEPATKLPATVPTTSKRSHTKPPLRQPTECQSPSDRWLPEHLPPAIQQLVLENQKSLPIDQPE